MVNVQFSMLFLFTSEFEGGVNHDSEGATEENDSTGRTGGIG